MRGRPRREPSLCLRPPRPRRYSGCVPPFFLSYFRVMINLFGIFDQPCFVNNALASKPRVIMCVCYCLTPRVAVACSMVAGADSLYGIVADPCDCQNYYQCEYNTTSQAFVAYQRSCNPCELWDQVVLTCIRDESKVNCTFAPSTEGIGKTHSVE